MVSLCYTREWHHICLQGWACFLDPNQVIHSTSQNWYSHLFSKPHREWVPSSITILGAKKVCGRNPHLQGQRCVLARQALNCLIGHARLIKQINTWSSLSKQVQRLEWSVGHLFRLVVKSRVQLDSWWSMPSGWLSITRTAFVQNIYHGRTD